jgi:hypothetical protein
MGGKLNLGLTLGKFETFLKFCFEVTGEKEGSLCENF